MKLTSLSLALGLTAGLVAVATPAMAQYEDDTQANPLADFQNDNNAPFSGRGDASSSMMQLMHRMLQGDRPNAASVAASQKENMDDAMKQFLARQRQMIRAKQQKSKPGTIAVQGPKGLIMIPRSTAPLKVTPGSLRLSPITIKPLTLPSK